MSSKRGRKRNDNLPPNRARDVQRAFRARRAAHLQALEQRVSELEEENSCLRHALNLPPASRPALGKGPTGKDKPTPADHASQSRHQSSRETSSADSPPSTRANSLSPASAFATSIRTSPRAVQVIDSGTWEQSLIVEQPDPQMSAPLTPSYQLPPVPAHAPPKAIQYPPYSNSLPPSTRGPISSGMYITQPQQTYPNSTDRPMSSYSSPGFMMRSEGRHDAQQQQQQQYSYSPQPFPDAGAMSHPSTPALSHSAHRDISLSFPPHRRSLTEPQGFRTIVNQFPHLPTPVHGIRLPSPPRLQGSGTNPPRATYGNDGH